MPNRCCATHVLHLQEKPALVAGPDDLEVAGIDCGDADTADDGVPDEYAYLQGRLPKRIRNLRRTDVPADETDR